MTGIDIIYSLYLCRLTHRLTFLARRRFTRGSQIALSEKWTFMTAIFILLPSKNPQGANCYFTHSFTGPLSAYALKVSHLKRFFIQCVSSTIKTHGGEWSFTGCRDPVIFKAFGGVGPT